MVHPSPLTAGSYPRAHEPLYQCDKITRDLFHIGTVVLFRLRFREHTNCYCSVVPVAMCKKLFQLQQILW